MVDWDDKYVEVGNVTDTVALTSQCHVVMIFGELCNFAGMSYTVFLQRIRRTLFVAYAFIEALVVVRSFQLILTRGYC